MLFVHRTVLVTLALVAATGLYHPQPIAAQTQSHGDLAIVVNSDTPVTKLTFAELRQVFLGDKQYWSKDMPVVLLMRAPTSAERDAVLNVIYQMKEPQFKQYWIAKIFRAELSSPPKIVYSSESTLSLIQAIPGAIAFMAASDVKPGLKVVRIDDHLPGEPGYRLHLSGK
jgi:ABC-type phosphate transport system substrate-binding protein